MSDSIEEPYVIAHLPKPREDSCVLAAPVHSIGGSRKRKRHEIAIGVDGENVNIYNVRNQSTAASYALPPQTLLAAAPCSAYCKRARPLQHQRQTYIALRNSQDDSNSRLLRITENLGKSQSLEHEPHQPSKRERQLRHGRITGLDIVSTTDTNKNDEEQHSVVVSYKNGFVECLASDLSATRWEQLAEANGSVEVEHAEVLDFETARKGVLRGREDAVALLDSFTFGTSHEDAPPLLFHVTKSGSCRRISIYALRNTTGNPLQGHRMPLGEILSYELPSRHDSKSDTAYYELHAASGMLYQCVGQQLTIFDLSGTLPKKSFELCKKGAPQTLSFSRLSSAAVLAVSQESIAIHDTKYGSVLSSIARSSSSAQGEMQSPAPLSIIAHFADIGIVTAISGSSLVALQVGDNLAKGRRTKARATLLSDVMGKGKFAAEIITLTTSKKKEKRKQKWEDWKAKVDRLAQDLDVEQIERFIAEDLDLAHPKTSDLPNGNAIANGVPNGHPAVDSFPLWDLSLNTFDAQRVQRKKANYLLATVFTKQQIHEISSTGRKLQVVLLSRNILRWLAMAGYLNAVDIEHVSHSSATGLDPEPSIAGGDIMIAIQQAEPTFVLMCDLLTLPVHWDLTEVVQALKLLIQSLQDRDPTSTNEYNVTSIDGDIPMVNGDDEARLRAEEAAADRQLAEANGILESGGETRSHACRIIFARLLAFPHRDVVQTMHQMMNFDQLHFMIGILRLELSDCGWLTRYLAGENDLSVDQGTLGNVQDIPPSNQAIQSIAQLLNCAVDAVGLTGWLVGQSADLNGTHDLIRSLGTEVSFAMSGLLEYVALENMLHDISKTARAMEKQHHSLKRKYQSDEMTCEENFLPLGGRIEPPQLGWNSKAGKKAKRAAFAEQESRSVGKYAFEKIKI